jgi:hypothetical protein
MKRSAIIGLTLFGAIAVPAAPAVALKVVVATYHYDNQRTGWNGNETTLTPANVGSTSFGVLAQVGLDDQVDAQPLVVPHYRRSDAGNVSSRFCRHRSQYDLRDQSIRWRRATKQKPRNSGSVPAWVQQ